MQIRHPTLRALVTLLAAAALAAGAAAPAQARPVTATVVGPPANATLPVLLSPAAAMRAGGPVLGAKIPGAKPVHWGGDRLALAQLRPGDRVTLDLRGTRVRSIALRSSGVGDAFDRVDRQLAHLAATSEQTIALAAPIANAQSESASRAEVAALRAQLTTIESELTAVGDDLDTSLRRLRGVLPADPTRRAAVQAAQADYATRLTAVRDSARAAADQTVVAAGSLGGTSESTGNVDGTQTPVDPAAPFTLPAGSVSEVSSLSERLGDVLASLGLPRP